MAPGRFDYFVIYAEMRTGSNFLEENVNEYPGLTCYGEAFNPVFIGGDKKKELFGITLSEREANPVALLDQLRIRTEGLPGFRFFHDHDPRILDLTLKDPRCGKVILTRNPLDSYVSRKIAGVTGQWRLNDLKNARSAKITFDRAEFEEHLDRLQGFQQHLMHALQVTGQTAFYIGYDDIGDLEVLDGLAVFLGVTHKKERTSGKTKVQNPSRLEDKVENFDQMQRELATIDRFDLSRTPNFEPRRAAVVPSYVACGRAPLLFQPIKAGPVAEVEAWMSALDGAELQRGFSQKSLRVWKRQNPGHRSFTVVRHPVRRLYQAFADHILGQGPDTYTDIRRQLRQKYNLPVPGTLPEGGLGAEEQRAAFLSFARFVAGNLGGQTSIRVDGAWASQSEILSGFAQIQVPDMVLREEDLVRDLAHLAGDPTRSEYAPAPSGLLEEIYTPEVEEAVRAAYQKDYMMFGYRRWAD